ncbi:hypothetical protein [Arthrobacter sp. 2MCAF14]|uniref:hypothetical protein n=1 Tax=Arthrobacter sp. 2MCAF14 TaxID=3232982 RepID=UPI003F924B28
MSAWHPYDDLLMPAFHERFEQRWGKGTAPFLDPAVQVHLQPLPRAQWINADTGAAVAVVPIWSGDPRHRSFGVFYLPPFGDIWVLHPGHTAYLEPGKTGTEEEITLRNDAFRKAVNHAKEFIYGTQL